MKLINLPIVFLIMISFGHLSLAQDGNCKVLKAEISGNYFGQCKKGLATGKGIAQGTDTYEGKFKEGLPNGMGVYKFSNGDIYEGSFRNGMKHGQGKFTFKHLGKDSVYIGVWDEDKLVRKIIPPKYQIIRTSNIQSCSIQKINNGNRVMFSFRQNGSNNTTLSNLLFGENGGRPLSVGAKRGFDNVSFPFTCKVSYVTANKFKSVAIDAIVEIQINEPGDWLVTIDN